MLELDRCRRSWCASSPVSISSTCSQDHTATCHARFCHAASQGGTMPSIVI